jgi:hypothetical protein
VVVLSLAMLRFAPGDSRREPEHYTSIEIAIDGRGAGGLGWMHQPLYGALWMAGIAQQYQLFDWIDQRNLRFRYDIVERDGNQERPIAVDTFFPASNRSALLQSYLHDRGWVNVPPERRGELKRSLALRLARRYCRERAPRGTVVVRSTIERITGLNPRLVEREAQVLFRFAIRHGVVVLLEPGETEPSSLLANGMLESDRP